MHVPILNLAAQHAEVRAEIDAAFARIASSSGFVGGDDLSGFEQDFADYLGVAHVVGVANGTDAIEIALQAAEVGPGDTVVTTPFTFAGTVEAIVRVGAQPYFVDIKADDLTIDPDLLQAAFTARPIKAVIPVHLYGYAAEMERIGSIAHAHGAVVIEDAAQAHGAWDTIAGARRRVGTLGDLACFSFYPTKNLGAFGDAGAVVSNDAALATRTRLLANHGDAGKYEHVIANGRNSRLDALQAAVLRIKLRRLDAWNEGRRRVAAWYQERLRDLPLLLPHERSGTAAVYHQFVVRVAQRDALRAGLSDRGVGTALHYPRAVHQQPGFRALHQSGAPLPVAEQSAAEVLSLPMSPHLRSDEVDYVADAVRDLLLRASRERVSHGHS
jgi:dTDP-4-amino-4,6-dideoxygalactose transaminase